MSAPPPPRHSPKASFARRCLYTISLFSRLVLHITSPTPQNASDAKTKLHRVLFSPTADDVDRDLEKLLGGAGAGAGSGGKGGKRPTVTVAIPTDANVVFPAGRARHETPAPERVDEMFAQAAARPTLQIAPAAASADDEEGRGAAGAGAPLRRLETPNVAQLEAMLDAETPTAAAAADAAGAGASAANNAALVGVGGWHFSPLAIFASQNTKLMTAAMVHVCNPV